MKEEIENISSAKHFQIFEIKKLMNDFSSFEDYMVFHNNLMSNFVDPNRDKFDRKNGCVTEQTPKQIWALVANEYENGIISNPITLAICELDIDYLPGGDDDIFNRISFVDWVTNFNPVTWGDWLMVPHLFNRYICLNVDLPELMVTPDPWIDGQLKESRGYLMWRYQAGQLIRRVADIGINEASLINSNYILQKPGTFEKMFDTVYSNTGQTINQIFEERIADKLFKGTSIPDYILADWLSKHFHRVEPD